MSQVSIQFGNNKSQPGQDINTNVNVSPSGQDQKVSSLLANTNVGQSGSVSYIQLVSNFQKVTVVVKKNGQTVATLNPNTTYKDLGSAVPIGDLVIHVTST